MGASTHDGAMSIAIGFSDPCVPVLDDDGEHREPLSLLDADETSPHLHGTLWIRLDGVDLPALGYFGVDDACLGEWAAALDAAHVRARRVRRRSAWIRRVARCCGARRHARGRSLAAAAALGRWLVAG